MGSICVFGGTYEGRCIVDFLKKHRCNFVVSVATEYGEDILKDEDITVYQGRLSQREMEKLFLDNDSSIIIDATHPFATAVSENIMMACEATKTEYIRVDRFITQQNGFDSMEEAAEHLNNISGNILFTIGSKEIIKFKGIKDFAQRAYIRVLPMEQSIKLALEAGIKQSNIIAMQGPFSVEMNTATINTFNIKAVVTKNSGETGGFLEKLSAVNKAGVQLVTINPKNSTSGISVNELKIFLMQKLNLLNKAKLLIIGAGMDNTKTLTQEAIEGINSADIIIGAKRLSEKYNNLNKKCFNAFTPEDIYKIVCENKHLDKIAILMSGDIGFYSGAKKLYDKLSDYDIQAIPGVSSLVYLAAKTHIPWEDMALVSNHGKHTNIIHYIKNHHRVFTLLDAENTVASVCKKLCEYGYGDLKVYIGECLGDKNEKIVTSTVGKEIHNVYNTLSCMIIENSHYLNDESTAISDNDFTRVDHVPMTKYPIRAISIARLNILKSSIIYDIGAGTGSLSIEMAIKAYDGKVYAIEKNSYAVAAIHENKIKFKVDNLNIIDGFAPSALISLEKPTHAFIGGSSGNIQEIIRLLVEKNQDIRIVANAITIETISQLIEISKKLSLKIDIMQISASQSKEIGGYNMLTAQNPIFIATIIKGEA